jgi:hypothetical protein
VGSAGLDAGTCLSIIVVFLTLVLPKDGTISLGWVGNTINEKSELACSMFSIYLALNI